MCMGFIPEVPCEHSTLPLHVVPPSLVTFESLLLTKVSLFVSRECCVLDGCAGVSARVVSTVSTVIEVVRRKERAIDAQ
jgi:hypothetical protein